MAMEERHVERELEILTAIEEGVPLTQRALAQRLGVALGLTNLYLKRLAGKGFIKIREFPTKPYAGKRLRYVLTPKGVGEKARLTYEYMGHSLNLFRRTRDNLREAMGHLSRNGMKRIALCGAGRRPSSPISPSRNSGSSLSESSPVTAAASSSACRSSRFPNCPAPTWTASSSRRSTSRMRSLLSSGAWGFPPQKFLTLRRPATPPSNGNSIGASQGDGGRAAKRS